METKEERTELVQLIRQLRDYVILDRKDYEKLVQNSSPEKFNESALEARDVSIKLLEQQLARMEKIPTEQNKHLPCVTNKVYEITLHLMFNREFMNDVYRTFRIISRGL